MKRPLSDDERQILGIAQEFLGPQNCESDVFFTDDGGAAILAKTAHGSPCILLHLTNLADFCRDGSMTRADIIRDIERGCGTGAD
jgi:hypothetical protein